MLNPLEFDSSLPIRIKISNRVQPFPSYFTVDGNRNLIPSHRPATKTWNEFPSPPPARLIRNRRDGYISP